MPAAPKPRSPSPQTAASPVAPPSHLFVGTSGWAYPTWRPGFYPADVPPRAFLHFYASRLSSVEVNYTFRRLPKPAQLRSWLDATPAGFRFSFKAPQRITHFQRLRDSQAALAEWVAAVAPAHAEGRLGTLLFQLPPNFGADSGRLAAFLDDPIFAAHPYLQTAFEFRHPGWFTDATYNVLHAHHAALCVADSEDLATPDIATADFRCYRLRRPGGYSAPELQAFAKRLDARAQSSDLYVYLRHEDEPTGALNAVTLLAAAAGPSAGAGKNA